MQKFHLTQASLNQFKQELVDLKQKLTEVIQLVVTAREQGDLSENSEYQSAKNEQDMVNNRILELEHILKNYILVDESDKAQTNITDLGSVIRMRNIATSQEKTYKLVGTLEVNPFENKISVESDVGKSLMGKIVNDEVVLPESNGRATYQVVAIE